MIRTIAITLKIPDNAAYTALTALQKLGFDVARVERSDVYVMTDNGDEFQALRGLENGNVERCAGRTSRDS